MGSRHSTLFVFFLLSLFLITLVLSVDSDNLIFVSTVFLVYVTVTVSVILALILHFEPRYGQKNMLVYLGICSLMGSLTVLVFHRSL